MLLEAADPSLMPPLLTNSLLRSYLLELISPRHAVVQPAQLNLFLKLMERRGLLVKVKGELAAHKSQLEIKITRRSLQKILAALTVYRRLQVEYGYEREEEKGLIGQLRDYLTIKEQQEALSQADDSFTPVNLKQSEDTPTEVLAEGEATVSKIAEAIAEDRELWLEYTVPGRQPQNRRVLPLALWEEHNITYLRAYCFLRKEERTFRIDRLKMLKLENPPLEKN